VQVIRGTHGEVWSRVVLDLPAKYQVVYANGDDPVYAVAVGQRVGLSGVLTTIP
jgi:hypothetical protein